MLANTGRYWQLHFFFSQFALKFAKHTFLLLALHMHFQSFLSYLMIIVAGQSC